MIVKLSPHQFDAVTEVATPLHQEWMVADRISARVWLPPIRRGHSTIETDQYQISLCGSRSRLP
jgi:hypothetical protein